MSDSNELHGTSNESDALARAVFIATMVGCIAFVVGVFVIIL